MSTQGREGLGVGVRSAGREERSLSVGARCELRLPLAYGLPFSSAVGDVSVPRSRFELDSVHLRFLEAQQDVPAACGAAGIASAAGISPPSSRSRGFWGPCPFPGIGGCVCGVMRSWVS